MAGEDINVAGVSARLSFDLDETGAQRFERRLKATQLHAKEGAEAHLGFEMDDVAIEAAYNKRLDEVQRRVASRDRFRAKLGADFDVRSFNVAYRQMQAAEKSAERERTAIRMAGDRERIKIASDETREEIRLHTALKREVIRNNAEMERAASRRAESDRRAAQRSMQTVREVEQGFRGIRGGGGRDNNGLGSLLSSIGPNANEGTSGLRQLGYAMRTLRTVGLVTAIGAAVAALASLVAGAAAATAALSPLAGLLATIPAAVGITAQAFGTLALAGAGVGKAVTAGLNAQARATNEAAIANRRMRTATEGVMSAQKAVKDAHNAVADAAHSVEQAERGVEAAHRGVEAAGRDVEKSERGVAQAQQALTDATDSAKTAQVNLTQARVDAGDKLRQLAQELASATSAVGTADRGVETAEARLSAAQTTSRETIKSLTEARKDARRALEDLNESASDAIRTEQHAVLDLADARDALAKVNADPTASPRDRQRATLAVADAENTLSDAHTNRVRTATDANKANQQGVNGSSQVQSAIKAVTQAANDERDAQLAVTQASRDVNDALRDEAVAERNLSAARKLGIERSDGVVKARKDLVQANRDVLDAEQGVLDASQAVTDSIQAEKDATVSLSEARRGVVTAQRGVADAAQGVVDANQGVADAQQNVKDASEQGTSSANAYAAALKKLAPAQQSFVKYLVSLNPVFTKLQQAAGEQLFSGVERGVRSAMKNFGILERGLVHTSGTLGNFVADFGQLLGSKGFGKDFETLMGRNDTIIRRTGDGIINLTKAATDLTIAAGPLVDWLTKGALRLTEWVEKSAHAGRESGALGRFFDQTRIQADRLWRILVDVGTALINIGKQAYPLGSDLLRVLTLNAEKFKDWTESAKGSNSIAKYFKDARPAIDEFAGLVKDVIKAFFRLGDGKSIVPLIRSIRYELLPALEEIIRHTGAAFGPAFVGAISQIISLFSKLVGNNGPLVIFARMLDGFLTVLNHIIDRVPALGTAIGALILLGGLSKALGLLTAVTGINSLIGRMRTLRNLTAETSALNVVGGVPVVPGGGVPRGGVRPTGTQFLAPVVGGRQSPVRGPALVGEGGFVRGRPVIDLTGRQTTADGRPIPRTVVGPTTFDQRYGNVPGARFAGPASEFGQVRGQSALVNGLRSAGAGASALLGGPVGIAIITAIAGSFAVSALNRSRDNFEGKQTNQFTKGIGAIRSSSDLSFIQSFLAGGLPKGQSTGDSQLVARGLKRPAPIDENQVKLAERFRKLTGVNPDSERQLENLRKKYKELSPALTSLINNLSRFKNSFPKLKVEDIIDPNAAAQVLSSFNRLRKFGSLNIEDFRRTIDFNFTEIGKAFTEGSRTWSDSMIKNIGLGIKALSKGMKDGKISAKDGMTEIKKLVQSNMTLSKEYLDTLSREGKQKLATNFQDAANAIEDQMKRAGKVTKSGMKQVRDLLAQELQVYGFTLKEARNELKPNTRFDAGPEEGSRVVRALGGTIPQHGQPSPRARRARGGMASPYGGSGADDHVLMDPMGRPVAAMSGTEGIVNEPQMGIIDHALSIARAVGGIPWGSLNELWSSGMRHFAGGGKLQLPANPSGPFHDTSGLPGYPAVDVFAPHGTHVGAPVGGKIVKLSGQAGGPGGGGAFGYSTYLSGDNRRTYFMTHFGSRAVRLGQRIGRGQDIGTVADYPDRADHIHEGIHGGSMAVTSSDGATISVPSIKPPKVKGGGAVGSAINRALRLSTSAANSLLTSAGGSGGTGTFTGDGSLHADPGVISGFRRAISTQRANPVERLGLWEAGIVESGLQNLNYGDADSLGSLQERVSIYGRAHALNPFASASRFLGAAKAYRPWKGTAGILAATVQGPRRDLWGRYDAVSGQARRYLAKGGKIPKFVTGGKVGGRKNPYAIGQLKAIQADRIGDIDDLITKIERDRTVYNAKDANFGRTEEVYINPTTGEVDKTAIERRASELSALLSIRNRILDRLEEMKKILARVVESYKTIIKRLKESRKHSTQKERSGIDKSIAHYRAERKTRKEQLQDVGYEITAAHYDVDDITNEAKSLRGTVAAPPDPGEDVSAAEPDAAADSTPGEAALTADQQAQLDQAARLKEIVAKGEFLNASAAGILGGVRDPNSVGSSAPPPLAEHSPELQAKAAAMGVDLNSNPAAKAASAAGGAVAGGGVTVNNYISTLHPSDPGMLTEIGQVVTEGLNYQGSVSSPRTVLGV